VSYTTPVAGVLLNYRDAARSLRCIRSLQADGVETIVVWDNSDDGGISAATLSSELSRDPGVHITGTGQNLGFAAGVNRALEVISRLSPGCVALIINNDAVLLSGGRRAMLAVLERDPATMMVAPWINHAGTTLGMGYYQRLTGLLSWHSRIGSFPYASGCCLLVNPRLASSPLFDESFFMYGEDWELGWRLSKEFPGSIVQAPGVWVEHEGSASSRNGSLFYETSMVAAHLRLVRHLASPGLAYFALSGARLIFLSCRALVRSVRARSLVPLKGLVGGVGQVMMRRGVP